MLDKYNRKRNFSETPEPIGTRDNASIAGSGRHFVIQKHHASRLHYDFRLETENGVLKSWAVPKGISLNPRIKRLAVLTEDHPLDYLLFEGAIPEGNYGAGTVLVWDTGMYILEKSKEKFSEQFDKGKITFDLHGQKVNGRFSLIRTGRENQWLLIKYDDQFASEEDLTSSLPDSVLSQLTKNSYSKKDSPTSTTSNHKRHSNPRRSDGKAVDAVSTNHDLMKLQRFPYSDFPNTLKPMLSTPVDKPFNDREWDFEIKWDGVRAIMFYHKSKNILELRSRTNKSIRHRYPEIINSIISSPLAIRCKDSLVLDGEIVVLDEQGHPDFQSHQRRMNVDNELDIRHLSKEIPSTFYIFDILHLDGRNLENIEFSERREILLRVVDPIQDGGRRIRISESFEGNGIELFENIRALKLEGIIAKNRHSKYLQGARTTDWLKIKNIQTQDCVIIGYTRGEGNRKGYFGSLLLAVYEREKLRFVGHSGSGFDFPQIVRIFNELQKIKTDEIPVDFIPYTNRDPVWVRPILVIEVKFDGWTKDKTMRAPIFLRIREDKESEECTLEKTEHVENLSNISPQISKDLSVSSSASASVLSSPSQVPSELVSPTFSSPVISKRRGINFSNQDKVFWPKSRYHRALTKGDLIDYYDKIGDYLLPFLKDRPLSLSRYPNGIIGKHFYQKNWNMKKPEFVDSVKIYSESAKRFTNYLICNNKETLLWLANLGCIEIHPWYSRVIDYEACLKDSDALDEKYCGINDPDFVVFDLDPYIYSGLETDNRQEPGYNPEAFMKTVDIAQLLRSEIFDKLRIKSFAKTSGKTGIHILVPISAGYSYDQTRSFAEIIGRILVSKQPDKITMEWDTSKRRGKIFFDHNQNAKGKTLASVFSARPTASATISMPLEWNVIDQILPTDFTILNVPDKMPEKRDIRNSLSCWSNILESRIDLAKVLERV